MIIQPSVSLYDTHEYAHTAFTFSKPNDVRMWMPGGFKSFHRRLLPLFSGLRSVVAELLHNHRVINKTRQLKNC